MILSHVREVAGVELHGPEVKNVLKKVLVSPAEGWEGYVMRQFELGASGYTPRHSHPWPHINYVVQGRGTLHLDGQDYPLTAGSFAYVPGLKLHQFKNLSEEKFVLICIVPEEGDK